MATASETIAIYNAVLQRDPTDAELAAFVASSQTPADEAVQIDLLINSSEAQTLVVPFLSLYQAIFGRVPDAAGLNFWVDQLRAGVTLPTIVTGDASLGIDGFANSAEFIAEYGENVDPTSEAFITALYQNFLGRAPDPEGLAFYMGLGDGATVGDVVIAFTSSPEFGAAIAAQSQIFLEKAADGTQDYLGSIYDINDDGVVDENDAIGPVETFFSLTENIDVPGAQPPAQDTLLTAGNDTVVGNSQTLNPGDRIQDTGGNDQVNLFLGGQGLLSDFSDSLASEGVETVKVQAEFGLVGLLTQNIQLDMLNATGVTTLINESSTGPLTVTNLQNNVDLEIRNVNQTVPPALVGPPVFFNAFNVIYDAGALGAMATQNVAVEDSLVLLDMGVSGGDDIGAFNFDAAGNNVVVLDDQFGSDIMPTSITITGDGFLALTDAGGLVGFLPTAAGGSGDDEFKNVATVDASANSGGVIVDLEENEQDVTFTGGAGNDGVLLNNASEFDGNDMADGGEGRDFIGVDLDSVGDLGGTNIMNFEDLVLMDQLEGDETLEDIDSLGFQTITIVGEIASGFTLTLDDADGMPVHLIGDNSGPLGGLLGPFFNTYFEHNGTLAFSDTDNVNFVVGLDPDLAGDANPEAGYAKFSEAADLPVQDDTSYFLGTARIEGVQTIDLMLNGDFTVGFIDVDTPDVLETFTISGEGDFILENGDDAFDGLNFNLTAQTGGFSNEGAGPSGSQTFTLADLGTSGDAFDFDDNEAAFNNYDFDPASSPTADTGFELGSVIAFGGAIGAADTVGDGDEDIIEFTTAGFGNIAVTGFDLTPGSTDVLDLSALVDNPGADIDYELNDAGTGVVIYSDEFDGNILLVGASVAQVDAVSNEIFGF